LKTSCARGIRLSKCLSGGRCLEVSLADPRSGDAQPDAPDVGYGSSKAALWSATATLAVAGAPYGITVNAVSPAARTRMNQALFEHAPPPPGLDLDPIHVARVVAWFVSEDAADVTGKVIHVAGDKYREYEVSRTRHSDLAARIGAAIADQAVI
jgi:hypothetical protein